MSSKLLVGNTYPIKEALKQLGGKWDSERKGWLIPEERFLEATSLLNNPPKAAKKAFNGPKTCRICGAKEWVNSRGYVQNKVYKSGECRDCYEDRKDSA